ncbi:MAG: hypothetical protein JO243_19505 [Solirubrobacterales bacterium]|nr:hypothetical protein [Solirubrobacterales bacterium]
MSTALALLLAAAGVAFGHAILPDHWVPLAVIGRTRRYPLAKVARLSGLAGAAHVLVSVGLGAVIVVVGLQLRSTVQHAQDAIVGSLLIATGLAFLILDLTGRGHDHDHDHQPSHLDHGGGHSHHSHLDHGGGHAHRSPHDHGGGHPQSGQGDDPAPAHVDPGRHSLLSIMVPFGAAASPDLTILPVFLAATTAGAGAAIGSVVVFGTVTIATIVGVTLLAAAGGYQVRSEWLDRWGNAFTATVLIVIGGLVLTGVI